MARVILEEPGEDVIVGGDDVDVIGTTSGGEVITVISGDITLDASFNQGGDTISLPGEAEDYTATFVGSRLILTSVINDVIISMPVPAPGDSYTLVFREDGDSREVTSNAEGQAVIGDQEFDQGETDQLDSNDAGSLADAINDFQDAEQAIADFEEENEATVDELNEMADMCEDELAEERANEGTEAELAAELALEEAQRDAAQDDVDAVPGLNEAIADFEDAVAAEEAAEDRENDAIADVAAEEARYNIQNPEDSPIQIRDDGTVYANAGGGEAIIVLNEDGELELTEYGEGQEDSEDLLAALVEREAAEDEEDDAEADREDAELALDLLDQNPDADDEREEIDDFEAAVAEFNEELAEYEDDPSAANAAGLEAAYAALADASEGTTDVADDTDLVPDGVQADEIAADEAEIRDAIEDERDENDAELEAAEAGVNPLYEALQDEQDDVDAAQDAIDEREALIAECEELRALAEEGNALVDARDEAAENVQDQGDFEEPRMVDGDEEATAGNDVFVAGDEDGEDGTIFEFGAEGNDVLFIGEEYTIVNLGEGDASDVEDEDVGDNDVLEAFIIETEDGVMVFLEENSEAGNVGDGDFFGPEILLDGVTMEDITVSEGFIMGA